MWDTYAEARAAALGYPVRVQRRRYVFRLYGGFNDVADTEFDRLWAGGTLDDLGRHPRDLRRDRRNARPQPKLRLELLRQGI